MRGIRQITDVSGEKKSGCHSETGEISTSYLLICIHFSKISKFNDIDVMNQPPAVLLSKFDEPCF